MFKTQQLPIIDTPAPNSVALFTDYHLSYNSSSTGYDTPTTALVLKNTVFLILCGNHKKGLEAAAAENGLQGAFNYFVDNIKQTHRYGEHAAAAGLNPTDEYNIHKRALEALGQDNIDRLRRAITQELNT